MSHHYQFGMESRQNQILDRDRMGQERNYRVNNL